MLHVNIWCWCGAERMMPLTARCLREGLLIVPLEIFTFGDLPWPDVRDEDVITRMRKGITMDKPRACPDDVFQVVNGSALTWLAPSDYF